MAYVAPSALDLQSRYPAFASVSEDTIDMWLEDAVTEASGFADDVRARAEIAYAAHRMAELGLGAGAIPAGVTSFKSGTFSATLSDAAAGRAGFSSTVYGREYLTLVRRHFGGPRLAWTPPANVL